MDIPPEPTYVLEGMAIFRKRPKPLELESLDQLMELARSDKPVLVDFWRRGCQSCRTMDGIVNELAEEYVDRATIVKANVADAPEAFQKFNVKATPTFLVLTGPSEPGSSALHQRFRATGLVKKDVLTSNLDQALDR